MKKFIWLLVTFNTLFISGILILLFGPNYKGIYEYYSYALLFISISIFMYLFYTTIIKDYIDKKKVNEKKQ